MKDFKPIFLLCTERCGSNFITKLFNNHKDVCGPSTKHIMNPLLRNYFRYLPFNDKNWEALLNDVLSLFAIEFSTWKSNFSHEELLENVPKGDVSKLIAYFFEKETKAHHKQLPFIKEIKAYEFFSYAQLNYPNSKYIYQVRDPRDMALSWKESKTHKGGIVTAAKQWKEDQQQNLKNYYLLASEERAKMIKYEDLIAEPEEALHKLTSFLGIEYDENMLAFKDDQLTQENAKKQESWKNLSKEVMSNNSKKYKQELSSQEIAIIEKICFFEMEHLAYETENKWNVLEKEITSELITNFDKSEKATIVYSPNDGVRLNMEAKKKFYQRIN